MVYFLTIVLSLGLSSNVRAGGRARPDQYTAIDISLIRGQAEEMKKPKFNLWDLDAITSRFHSVELSEIKRDELLLPASDRPKGSVQLTKVLNINPSK
jgi:hypothetical protein